jgi:hypothetical protein
MVRLTLEEKIELSDLVLSKRRNLIKRNRKETKKSMRLLLINNKLGEI